MDPFGPTALLVATTAATLLALRAVKRRTLSRAGAVTGFVVGFLLVATGLRGMVLFFMYQIGSKATKYKKDVKEKVDATVQHSSVRGASQVLAVSVTAVVLSLWHAWQYGAEQPIDFIHAPEPSRLATAVLAHHAVSLGDTLASELGMLSSSSRQKSAKNPSSTRPILITQPWRRVPVGTNGGVSLGGTLWSFAGGWIVGVLTVAMDLLSGIATIGNVHYWVRMSLYGSLCGFLGSLLDSILGATLQATFYDDETNLVYHQDDKRPSSTKLLCGRPILNNEQVNFVSVVLTTGIGGWLIAPLLFGSP